MKQNIRYRISLVLSVALCLFACNEEDLVEVTNQELSSLELYTSSTNTRTSLLEDGTTVVWNEDDELAVYDYEAAKHRFCADNVSGSSARFLGKITAKKENFLALYPYELGAEALSANNEIVVSLPQEQTAAESTFASNLNISVAKGARNVDGSPSNITFYNVCQLLKFTVPAYAAGKIKQIEFVANTPIAGEMCIDYSTDVPKAVIATDGAKSITIVPPAGTTTFNAGTYYIVSAPVELNGFTMSFTCDGTSYSLGSHSVFGGIAGKVYSLGNIDLVNTPKVSAVHQYANGLLQGTKLTISNAPMGESAWSAVIKNSSNAIVRTLQGTGTLESSEQDANWPYLLRGNYTMEYTFMSSNGKQISKTMAFNLSESPQFSVSVSAYTSYSYYVGDVVPKDVNAANKCDNVTVYAPKISINGIAPHIFDNANYSFNVTNNFGGIQQSVINGVYSYNDYKVSNYASYTLTGNVVFDGVTLLANKIVYITGLPYNAKPPTSADWTGTAAQWTDNYVRLHKKQTITKSFYCPKNIDVNVTHNVRVRRHTENTTYQLQCGGVVLKSLKGATNGGFLNTGCQTEVTDNGTYGGTLTTSNPAVSCYNSFGQDNIEPLEGTNAQVKQIQVKYR